VERVIRFTKYEYAKKPAPVIDRVFPFTEVTAARRLMEFWRATNQQTQDTRPCHILFHKVYRPTAASQKLSCNPNWCQTSPAPTGHSHPIVNEPYLRLTINILITAQLGNTMKNTAVRIIAGSVDNWLFFRQAYPASNLA
jgi:hypothetical protein